MKPGYHPLYLLLLLTCGLRAQDYHFSQFDANPYFVNPALSGERLGEYNGIRVNAAYRDQMANYTKFPGSYKNIAAGIDEPLDPKFSLSQFFFNNRAATSSFNTSGFTLGAAYRLIDQRADHAGNHNLSVGLQMGLVNKTIFPEKFTYDVQYSVNSDDGFDRSIPNRETYARQSYYDLNVNFGVYYRATSKNKKLSVFGGFAIFNLTEPNESFLDNGGFSALPLRHVLHGGAVIAVNPLVTVQPMLLYMNQAGASELNAGVLMFYKIENTIYQPIYGLSVRNKDALIFQLGLRCKQATVRVSYDVVTSYLKSFRNKGIEFSLEWTFSKKKKAKKEETPAEAPTAPESVTPVN